MGLFGGKSDSQPSTASKPVSRPQTSTAAAGREPASTPSGATPTVVGEDTTVKGEIESRSDMLVEGRVEGQIHGHKRVIIGEKGNVEAKVRADVIIVRGTVNGDIEGATRVEITATGKVFGNITSRAIVVTEGATFRGSSKMAQDAPIRKVSSGPAPPEKTDGPGPTAPVGTTPAKGTTTAQPPAPGTRSASGST